MEEEIYHKNAALEESHWWFLGRREIIKRILDDLPLPDKAKILEMGCGSGGNFPLLSRYGEVHGVELDEFARNFALKRRIAPVLPGSLPENIPYKESLFDLIVIMDVLEHVEEDGLSLVRLYERQNPGGHLLITVPAFSSLWSRHDELHHHKRRYTQQTLTPLVRQAGYDIVFQSYMNTILFPIIATLRIIKSLPGGDDLHMPPVLFNSLLYHLFASERYLLTRFSLPFGLSLVLLARKNQK